MKEELLLAKYDCDMCGETIYTANPERATRAELYSVARINEANVENTHLCSNCNHNLVRVLLFMKKIGLRADTAISKMSIEVEGKLVKRGDASILREEDRQVK